jgi:DNA polymerase
VPDSGSFNTYYLRQIGVASPIAEALSRKGEGLSSAEEPSVLQDGLSAAAVEQMPAEQGSPAPKDEPVARQEVEAVADDLASLRLSASTCTACELSASRNQVVFGVGSERPDVLFIGEAPGEQEDVQGEPFVGRAGQLLNQMLTAVQWSRDSVYIMNVIKCRPPGNRDPKPEEVLACGRWFDAQWEQLQPKVVCLLGRVAAQRILGSDAPLSDLRGRWHEYRGVPVWVTYHPAYLLRSPSKKAIAWQDFRQLAARCERPEA